MVTKMRMTGLWWMALLGIMLVPGVYAQREPEPAPRLTELTKAAKAEGELNLVAGGGVWGEAEGVKMIQDALNKRYGLDVRLRYAPGPSMPVITTRVIDTYKAGVKSDTDLLVTSAGSAVRLLEPAVARAYPWREVFPHIPEDTIEFGGQMVRFTDAFNGITYNTREIAAKDVPRRLEEMLHPRWKGKIASTPYAATLYYLASDRVWGYEKARAFVRALSRQVGGLIRCGEEARVASGEFLMLVMNCGNHGGENYARTTGAPVGTVVLEDAPVMETFYYIVPKNSARPNLATLLVGFLMSKEGQDLLYRVASRGSASVEGTPTNRKYNELKAKGVKLVKFTATAIMGEEGALMERASAEFRKILAEG